MHGDTPSCLSKVERERLVYLWNKMPGDMTPDEKEEMHTLECRARNN